MFSSLTAAWIQNFYASKPYYRIPLCIWRLLIQANSPVHTAGIMNILHVDFGVITTRARHKGWEQNMQLRSAVQISILCWEQKMWISPIHQKHAAFRGLHENTKGKKAFLMSDNEKHGWLSDLKLFNAHTYERERKREQEKSLKQIWKKMRKMTYYSRHQLMDHIYFVSIWNVRGILIIFPTKYIKKYSLENTANML